MSQANVPLKVTGLGATRRSDSWWWYPAVVVIVFGAFLVYAHVRVFENGYYYYKGPQGAHYLSPFYSPLFFDAPAELARMGDAATGSGHAIFKSKPWFLPSWFSPAMLILIFPAGFRFTCYYYRGTYYKAFWADPPACAVSEPRSRYSGETIFPLVLQNIHRYFLYAAVIFVFILAWDAIKSFMFHDPVTHEARFGIGIGSIILTLNVYFLAGYTFGCHSMRHLIGGFMDRISESPARKRMYDCVTCLNGRHPNWAWVSLLWVAGTDLYVRLLATGAIRDYAIVF